MWWIYGLLSAVFAALTAILVKLGVKNINSDLATAIRTVVVLVVTWGIFFARSNSGDFGKITKSTLVFLILSGIATGLSWIFYFKAMQLGKAFQVAAIDKLSVAFVVLLSVFILHETFTLKTAIGVAMIIGGAVVMIF
ncbi:MAG: EamA family transporter [Bacteroidia bacterium]